MVTLVKVGNNYVSSTHHEYQVSGQSDVASLPKLDKCAIGSLAYTADLEKIWILGSDNVWHLVNMGGEE